uniref:NADH dehydrogenase subunit 2 n=1 Tax=Taeniothrips eucharii TaxID=1818613 RepID=UPI0030DF7E59
MKNMLLSQKLLFMLTMIMSMIMCVSSDTILGIWMSMEINMISFITLMTSNQNMMSEKSTMMYFLIQSISSTMVIMSAMYSQMETYYEEFYMNFMFLAILMKLGMFPFYSWMITTIEGLSWNNCLILTTIQKIIPLMFMTTYIHSKWIITMTMMNMMMATFKGLEMFSLRKILGFSSMNHLSMMMMAMLYSKQLLKFYFMIYLLMTISLTNFLKNSESNLLFQLLNVNKCNKVNNFIMMVLVFSMAGIPPFIGFIPKMLVISMMLKTSMVFTSTLMLILNTTSIFFYMRLMLTNFIMTLNTIKVKKKEKKNMFPLFVMVSPFMMIM